MVQDYDIRLLPAQAADEAELIRCLAREKGLDASQVTGVRVLRRSVDARRRPVVLQLRARVFIGEPVTPPALPVMRYRDVSSCPPAVVVGAGPGGLFAALRLIELGRRPVVLERGKDVSSRKADIAALHRRHEVDPESNYGFGEGGAGAYSDGKLFTRSKKKGDVDRILSVFCLHGANPNILVDVHPHIGTDKLPGVIRNMRERILSCGGEVRFQTRADRLLLDGRRVKGVVTAQGEEVLGPVILATGHSARDVFHMLHDSGVRLSPKGIAVGARLEHPQQLIDQMQYHSREGRGPWLPAAEYSFVTQAGGRGVYSFCMCPGGFVVPAATGPGQLVVNGMSPSNRGSRWANSGMVVEVRPGDVPPDGDDPLFALLRFQERMERSAFEAAGRTQTAPAQRMTDFVDGRLSADLPSSSYVPGTLSYPMHELLPDMIATRLRDGFRTFGRLNRMFLTREAMLLGVETRTSSPLRVERDRDTLLAEGMEGLFPCGEGAGYAGGIVSAAIDGERCAEALVSACP